MNWQAGLTNAWSNIAAFVPKLVLFVIIVVIGWLIAKAVAKIVDAVLERVGFDRAVERGGIGQALASSKFDASDLIAKIAYYFILLITLQIAFDVWGPNAISSLLRLIVAWLPRLVVAIIIIVIAAAIAKAVKDILSATLGALSYGNVLANLASIFILFLGAIAALNQIGIATAVTTPVLVAILAALAGVVIVGVGGGLVRPMQQRWERWLARAEQEAPQLKAHMAQAPQRARERAQSYQDEQSAQPDQVYVGPPTGATAAGAPYPPQPGGYVEPNYPQQPYQPGYPAQPSYPPQQGYPQPGYQQSGYPEEPYGQQPPGAQ
jgi:mechanosensitive ion channel-like protein